MNCPRCGYNETLVKDSRPKGDGALIMRRRLCPHCQMRFTTHERLVLRGASEKPLSKHLGEISDQVTDLVERLLELQATLAMGKSEARELESLK